MRGGPDNPESRRFWLLSLGLSAAAVALAACGGPERPVARARPATAVAVVEVASRSWPTTLEVSARVEPLRRAMPGTPLLGPVEEVLRREGDRVEAGTVLARIQSRDAAARLAQAEAQAAAARAAEENSMRTRERIERLFEKRAASRKSLDDARAAHEAASASRRAAEQAVEAARVALGYAEVVAPFAGVVSERRVEAGDVAAPGAPLFVIEQVSKMKVEADVPESAVAALGAGDEVEVSLDAIGVRRRGTIAEVLPAADPGSRTFTVRVVLDNEGGALRSGMFARLAIPGKPRDVLAVPASAVVRRGPLTGAFVVDGEGRARLRWITLGARRGDEVEALTGLRAGERLALPPPEGLEDGQRVEVRE